jgi:hypothetical protein
MKMESSNTDAIDCFGKLSSTNAAIKSKSKAKLTKPIQEQINRAFLLKDTEVFKLLAEYQAELAAPIKQGIAEYLRLNPEEGEQREDTVNFLLLLREEARASDQIQYLATLSLWRHGHFEHGDDTLLKKWLVKSEKSRKQVSLKITELIGTGGLREKFQVLMRCKEIISELTKEDWNESKMSISEAIKALSADGYDGDLQEDLTSFENLMKDPGWVVTTRDEVLRSRIESVKSGIGTKSAPLAKQALDVDLADKSENLLLPVSVPENIAIVETGTEKRPEQLLKEKLTPSPEEKVDQTSVEKRPVGKGVPAEISEKTISTEGIKPVQKKLIEGIIKELSSANKGLAEQKIVRTKVEANNKKFRKKNSDLILENEVYAEENDKLVSKVQLLRGRLEEVNSKLEAERILRKRERNLLDSRIAELTGNLETCQLALDDEKATLERERQLSHATHRDAMHRANVELQARLTQISQAVGPIFKEFDEFEAIQDLHKHAKMILRITRNLQNALRSKGVKI